MDYRVVIGSAGLGAGLMYLLDQQAGKRRRVIIRDKAVHGAHVGSNASGKIFRDVRNRFQGLAAGVKRAFSRKEDEADDRVLVERVRSELGYVASHPGSIQVGVVNGRVKLSGVVLTAELANLLKRVRRVRGVREVAHELEVYEEPGSIPGLQGEGRRLSGGQFELQQINWSPAARLFTGFAGGALIVYGLRSGKYIGAAAAAGGLPLIARAATNMPLRRIVGVSGWRGVDIRKSININAPIEEVFTALSRVEDFPTFMTHIQKVSKLDGDRYRWTVSGPAGVKVNWDSAFTANVPNRRLAWRSEPGSMVKHAGVAELETNPDGSTAVNIRLTYSPLIGGVGHALLTLLGADPKTLLDEDLQRLKTFLETGKQARDAALAR